MGFFSNFGGGGAPLSYEEELRQQMLQRQQAMSTPGVGEGLPSATAASPGTFYGQPASRDTNVGAPPVAPLNEMEGIRNALAANAMREPPTPSYADHHAIHGRDEHGGFAKKKRSTGEKILRGIGEVALRYQASQGNQLALWQLKQMGEDKATRKKADRQYNEHHALVQNLMSRGISAQDAELYAQNPEKLGEEMVSRFRTRDVAPDHSIYTPGLGNQPDAKWVAPKTVEDGPLRVQVDPNTGANRTLYTGKTDAGWAAEESGFEPDTQPYQRFMQDFHLDGQGPTAVDMNQARITATNMRHNTPRPIAPKAPRAPKAPTPNSVIGRIMEKQASGARLTAAEQQTLQEYRAGRGGRRGSSGSRAATAVGADGRRIVVRNGKWVDAQTGRPVQ